MKDLYAMGRNDAFSDASLSRDYNLLMSSMQVSVSKHLLDEYFTMIWSNDFYYKIIRYPIEEYAALFHNRPDIYYQYHHYEDELEKIKSAVLTALNEGRSEYNLLTRMPVKGGGHVWVRMNGIFTTDKLQGYRICYTVITDVNDLVAMQKVQSITYNNIPGFVTKYLIRDHLRIELLEANDQFKAFFGACENRRDDGWLFRENLVANQDVIIPQLEHVKKGEHIRFLAKLQNGKGKTVWMQINGDCVDWVDGYPVYLLIYIDVTDVTELRKMREKLEEQAQQLRDALAVAQKACNARRDFLSRMSHEIRTPMNAIIGMTTIASAHLGDAGRIEDCLRKIGYSSKYLLSLINDILDMSKIEDGKMTVSHEPFSLPRLMESVTNIVYPQAQAQGLDFRESIQDVLEEELVGDATRVSQILLNLLSNAVKFTPEGGKVGLEVRQFASAGRIHLRFTVSDTGRGMTEEFLKRLYTPFEQEGNGNTGRNGTGLGMPITKNLVTLLGGTISVKSKVNGGTVFTVELPFDLANTGRSAKYPCLNTLKVLVSDNNRDDCDYVSLLLNQLGIVPEWVLSGRQAVEEVRRSRLAGKIYDICLIDWKMPDMDGIEATRQIRAIVGPDTPIIIMTAYDFSVIEAEAREAGVNLFLPKPFFASSLYNTLLTATGSERVLSRTEGMEKSTLLSGRSLLLVEDNELNLEIALEILKMAGAKVICARNGKEAVDWFLSPAGRDCDAILMDIQMPGMDGYQTARALRDSGCSNAGSVPIIAMTANAFQEDVAQALEAGMDAHIAKPIDVKLLYETIVRCFDASSKKMGVKGL